MRSVWSTLASIVVLAGLVGYIYFVDSKSEPNAPETKDKVWGDTLSATDMEEIAITLADGETARVQKVDGTWQLVEPAKAPADESELTSITTSLASLELQRVVDANAADVKQYGLDPARIAVAFRSKGQKDPRRIELGEKTPTGGDLYARVPGEKRVFLVSSFLESTFNKTPFALRDKTILKLDRDKADSLELVEGSTTIQLAKKGSDWMLVKPVAARADYPAAEGALERLASAQMVGITEPDASNLAKYGLDTPTATMTVGMGSSRATLLLGNTDNAVVFAKDASRPMVFTVPPTLKTDVIKTVSDLRRKDLFDSRSFTATHVEFRRGSETTVLDKSKDKDGKEIWKDGAGKDVESAKADDLLSKITGLRAASFEDKPHASLKTPALVVTIRFTDNRTETVTFGRAGTDVYASRSDEPGTAKVEGTGLDDAVKALDAVK
jgi:Domain of unknown function (DUF4340)